MKDYEYICTKYSEKTGRQIAISETYATYRVLGFMHKFSVIIEGVDVEDRVVKLFKTEQEMIEFIETLNL